MSENKLFVIVIVIVILFLQGQHQILFLLPSSQNDYSITNLHFAITAITGNYTCLPAGVALIFGCLVKYVLEN